MTDPLDPVGALRHGMSITAENGQVVWRMSPNRARKIAALLRAYTRAFSEAARLDAAATRAESQ